MVRSFGELILSFGGFDLRSARWRLDPLNARHFFVSAVLSLDDSETGIDQPTCEISELLGRTSLQNK